MKLSVLILDFAGGNQHLVAQLRFAVIEDGKRAAKEPARREAHGQRNQFIHDEIRYNEQINLAESHKGGKHDIHGHFAVACPALSAGINLIEAAEYIEGREPVQKLRAIIDYFGLIIEESNQMGGKSNYQCRWNKWSDRGL